ncbi:hypothetical protein HDU76_007607, partial [Blyttiomyces sp. JEL0837]
MLDILIPNNLPPHLLVYSKGSVQAKLSAEGEKLLNRDHIIEFKGTPEEFSALFTSIENNRQLYPPPTAVYNRLLYTIEWTSSYPFILETNKYQETPVVMTPEVVSVHEEGHEEESEETRSVQVVGQQGIAVVQEQKEEEMGQQQQDRPGQEQEREHMMNVDEVELAVSQTSSQSTTQLQLVPFQLSNVPSTQVVLHPQEQFQSTTLQQSIGTSGVSKRRRSESSQESLHLDIMEARDKSLNEKLLDDINNNPPTLKALKDSGKTIPAIGMHISDFPHQDISPVMRLLELYKVACMKNPLTPFQLESLKNLQLFLLACCEVAQQAGNGPITSIDQKKETISGDFLQFNLGNDLAVLDEIGVYVSQIDFDVSLITPSLIGNAKMSILQVANGLHLLTESSASVLFADENSVDQRPHADGIEQLRLSLIIYINKDGLVTRILVNDNLPFFNPFPGGGNHFEFNLSTNETSVIEDSQKLHWFLRTFSPLGKLEDLLFDLDRLGIDAHKDGYTASIFLGNVIHWGQGLKGRQHTGTEAKLFLQFGCHTEPLSADYQISPFTYHIHTQGIGSMDALFIWDINGRTNLNNDIHNTFVDYADKVKANIGLKNKDLRTFCKSASDFTSLRAKWIKGFTKLFGDGKVFRKAVIGNPGSYNEFYGEGTSK